MSRLAKAAVTGALLLAAVLPLVLYFLLAENLAFVSEDGWVSAGKKLCPVEIFFPGTAAGAPGVSIRDSSVFHQGLAIAGGFWIKPLYTVLALLIALRLWRRTESELRALKWAMLCFFLGENFCAANYLLTRNHDSFVLEYLHGLGMILCFGLASYALFEGMDRRLVHVSHSEEKCAALPLCRGCVKYQAVPCGLERVFILIGVAAALVACIPLSGSLRVVSYNTRIFGVVYNYAHPLAYQLTEIRYFPVVASALFLAWGSRPCSREGRPRPNSEISVCSCNRAVRFFHAPVWSFLLVFRRPRLDGLLGGDDRIGLHRGCRRRAVDLPQIPARRVSGT